MESDGTSRGKTSEISTVSLSIDPARHATRSALALRLVRHSRCSSGRAVQTTATLRRPAHYLNPGVADDRAPELGDAVGVANTIVSFVISTVRSG